MSTGASTYAEVVRATNWAMMRNSKGLTLLACSMSYPAQKGDAHLARMKSLRSVWPDVGYSDHTFGVGAIIRAKHLGAVLVEKHFTITPGAGGDHDFAVTPAQMQNLVEWGSGDPTYDGSPVLEASQSEQKAKMGARRSIMSATDLKAGRYLKPDDVVMLRPGGGLEPWEFDTVDDRPLLVDVAAGQVLHGDMF
jgi:sialic acid synthase SpsE